MITQLSSPAVCLIDDEKEDYEPILAALNGLYVSCVHILGNDVAQLPSQPFKGLKLVFLDLHLSGTVGKPAASHTANVFKRVVAADTAPVLVIIWSKYAGDKVNEQGVPREDQITEADLFKKMLLQAVPAYKERLIFAEMAKPKPDDRAEGFVTDLKQKITESLSGQAAVDLVWKWDGSVREACQGVTSGLTALAALAVEKSNGSITLSDAMKDIMRRMARAQGEADFKSETATRHLSAVMSDLLRDYLEQDGASDSLADHSQWLGVEPQGAGFPGLAAHTNALLLTSSLPKNPPLYGPGTVYYCKDPEKHFPKKIGGTFAELAALCCTKQKEEWGQAAKAVFVEISPDCDVAQKKRTSALLVAGVVVPGALSAAAKSAPSLTTLKSVYIRKGQKDFPAQEATLVFCHLQKVTIPASDTVKWLSPWFRLRELPTAALRNAQASHAARVGYVSLQA